MNAARSDFAAASPEAIERLKTLVLATVTSPESKRSYRRSIARFIVWLQSGGHGTELSEATVRAFQNHLIASDLSPSAVNTHLTAIRHFAVTAAENGVLSPQLASAISRVKGNRREAVRVGTPLTLVQAEEFIAIPNAATLKGKRDRALFAVLITCGLRRGEVAALSMEHLQRHEGRWVIREIVGKGRILRSVPLPLQVKAAIDVWIRAAAIHNGRIFRAVNKGNRVTGEGMTAQSIFEVVRKYAGARAEFEHLGPDDLRRFQARWSRKDPAALEKIRVR
jgi:site-specific recombinase XerD